MILDDGYHIKGYQEFWVNCEIFTKMQEVMNAIRNQDSMILERYHSRLLRYDAVENLCLEMQKVNYFQCIYRTHGRR